MTTSHQFGQIVFFLAHSMMMVVFFLLIMRHNVVIWKALAYSQRIPSLRVKVWHCPMIWGSGQVLGYHWEQRQDKSLGEILVTSKSFQIQNMFFLSVKQRCNTEELPEFLPQREFQKKSEKKFVCTENRQLHVTFSSFVYSHSFCCSSWSFKNWWVLKKMHKIAISLSAYVG